MPRRNLLKERGGRIDPMRRQEGAFDSDARIDQAIAESFPASDPPSWSAGVDEAMTHEKAPRKKTAK